MTVLRNQLTIVCLLAVVVVTLFMSSTAISGTISVAVLGSPGDPQWNDDVQTKLMNTGLFSTVDVYAINIVTPTLDQLLTYNSVLVYSDFLGYNNPVQLGNNLADYVDAGGGVVVAVFGNASFPFGGRFATDNYWGIVPASQDQGVRLTLGTIYDPENPILAGVTSFDGGSSSYRSTGSLHPDAIRVADWSNGSPLVVTRQIGSANRVDLNFFPPSSDARGDFWVATTGGALLMGNSLVYAANLGGSKPHHRGRELHNLRPRQTDQYAPSTRFRHHPDYLAAYNGDERDAGGSSLRSDERYGNLRKQRLLRA
jgi:hypothetical protein